METNTITRTEEILLQIRDAIIDGNTDRKTIKGYERSISQCVNAIRQGRTGSEATISKDPLSALQRKTINEVKRRYYERRVANPNYSLLSVSKELVRESKQKNKPCGYNDVLSLNHRAYIEIKREDAGLPPF